jgi:hypothetical protein
MGILSESLTEETTWENLDVDESLGLMLKLNLRKWDDVEWIHVAQDRDKWQADGNGFLDQLSK